MEEWEQAVQRAAEEMVRAVELALGPDLLAQAQDNLASKVKVEERVDQVLQQWEEQVEERLQRLLGPAA